MTLIITSIKMAIWQTTHDDGHYLDKIGGDNDKDIIADDTV